MRLVNVERRKPVVRVTFRSEGLRITSPYRGDLSPFWIHDRRKIIKRVLEKL